MKRRIAFAVAAFLLVLAGWQIFQRSTHSPTPLPSRTKGAVAVEVTPVTTGDIREIGVFSGTLLPESQFTVAPKIAGKLEKILVNIGDRVERGQLIALIDDAEFVQQVDQAKAERDVAIANVEENRSALNLAKREFERAKALRAKKIVSVAELDAAEAQFNAALAKQKVADAQVAQKEAALKAAMVRMDYTRIRALWHGGPDFRIVGERFVDDGAMLAANTPVATIIQIDPLTAVIHVIEKDYPRIRTGQKATIETDAYPGRAFAGTIARIAPLLKEAARQARVELTVPNGEEILKPGMFIRVGIEFSRGEGATLVPVDALTKRDSREGVFLLNEETGTAGFVPVTVGIVNGERAEIIEPALAGLVVTVGQHLLEDGTPVVVPENPDASSPQQAPPVENPKGS